MYFSFLKFHSEVTKIFIRFIYFFIRLFIYISIFGLFLFACCYSFIYLFIYFFIVFILKIVCDFWCSSSFVSVLAAVKGIAHFEGFCSIKWIQKHDIWWGWKILCYFPKVAFYNKKSIIVYNKKKKKKNLRTVSKVELRWIDVRYLKVMSF